MTETILDHSLITQKYFFPRRDKLENPFWVDCGDVKLSCYYHRHAPTSKTVIFYHGNGEVVSDYLELFVPIFNEMGFNLLLAEYRGYGVSSGVPALRAMLDDVEKTIQAVGVPHEKLILFGRSIGSLYAIHGVHLFPRIAGLIIESGIAVLLERLLMRLRPEEIGVTLDRMERAVDLDFNNREKLAGYKGSTLVIHARHDSLVHYSHGKKIYEWAPEPKKLELFEKGDHNDIMVENVREYFQAIYAFISGLG